MKNILFIMFSVLCLPFYAQTIDLKTINSKNILELFDKVNSNQNGLVISNSITSVLQKGDSNYAEIINKSGKGVIFMSQNGDYNTTFFINPDKNKKPEAEVNVNGNNNHIDITGVNSISEKIILNFSTNDKMVFIRNY